MTPRGEVQWESEGCRGQVGQPPGTQRESHGSARDPNSLAWAATQAAEDNAPSENNSRYVVYNRVVIRAAAYYLQSALGGWQGWL